MGRVRNSNSYKIRSKDFESRGNHPVDIDFYDFQFCSVLFFEELLDFFLLETRSGVQITSSEVN